MTYRLALFSISLQDTLVYLRTAISNVFYLLLFQFALQIHKQVTFLTGNVRLFELEIETFISHEFIHISKSIFNGETP